MLAWLERPLIFALVRLFEACVTHMTHMQNALSPQGFGTHQKHVQPFPLAFALAFMAPPCRGLSHGVGELLFVLFLPAQVSGQCETGRSALGFKAWRGCTGWALGGGVALPLDAACSAAIGIAVADRGGRGD